MPKFKLAIFLLFCSLQCQALAGFREVQMPTDGDCLYWSVAAGNNLLAKQNINFELEKNALQLRQQVIELLESNQYDDYLSLFLISAENPYSTKADYLQGLKNGDWGGELELRALSHITGKALIVHSQDAKPLRYAPMKNTSGEIHLSYSGAHYNLLTNKE